MLDLDDLIDAFAARGIEGERPWRPPTGSGPFAEGFYLLGDGNPALEVCVVPAHQRPRRDDVRELWRTRQGRQATPLLLIAPFCVDGGTDSHVCGPTEDDLAVRELPFAQAAGLAAGALAEPSGLAAVRYLREHTPREGEDFQGLVNQGMFAAHTLRTRAREMPEWPAAAEQGARLRQQEGRDLVRSLGFTIEQSNTPVHVLRAPNEQARAVAIFLDRRESPDAEGGRFGDSSALSQAFTRAERDNVPFVIFTRGSELRLYAVTGYEGVGRKGQAETYVQANVTLLADDEVGFLPLIFSAEALLDGGTFERILNWSRDFSADLSARLRERVYKDVVPTLAVAVAQEHARHDRDADRSLADIYEETLVILFRLLFLAYAEDRGLLPYASNEQYRRNSLKATARAVADRASEGKGWDGVATTSLWTDAAQLFEAIDIGNDAWGVPPYNGGLFSPDPSVSQAGAAIGQLRLTDERFGPPLTALLTEHGEDGLVGPVDFRSLSVRDFGTIYEGLLESSLSVATTDLVLDVRENYVSAGENDEPIVRVGDIYFHNRSGARKATGSYFTKHFAVEHLLDRALEPALDAHLDRLRGLLAAGHDDEAGRAFFDFRCADLSMGSGHFLVAAVDHIERRLAQFLDENPIAAVEAELDVLRAAANEHLGDSAVGYEIERRQLLRRQVARRCVYGVDLNHIAVELARLSLWVHTFVPGLPLSFLDHNLVQGDSLTGIGTIDEAVAYLSEQAVDKRHRKRGQVSVFENVIVEWLEEARGPLLRLGRASDATKAELKEVRAAAAEATERIQPVRKLFDLVTAMRAGDAEPFSMGLSTAAVEEHPQLAQAEALGARFGALHFPVAFPEVFLRERPGFDCIIGNPPWEKVKVEEHGFWALRFPGLRGLPIARLNEEVRRLSDAHPEMVTEYEEEVEATARLRAALREGPFPGLGTGDIDLYKAFAWRFTELVRAGGFVGVVLPRGVLAASGTARWRDHVLADGTFEDVTTLTNSRGWVFDEVHQQFTIGLVTIRRGARPDAKVRLRGPFASLADYQRRREEVAVEAAPADFRSWSVGAAFPLLPSTSSGDLFLKLRRSPRLDDKVHPFALRPVAELHATGDKEHFILEPQDTENLWPVYKGGTFDIWQPDFGVYYAWVEPTYIRRVLQERRLRQQRNRRSAFSALSVEEVHDPRTLPAERARIAYREVTRATDSRTVRAALIPPHVVANHKAPYLLRSRGDEQDEAYVLGVLSSIALDWYARRFVELGLTFDLLNAFPVPAARAGDPLREEIVRSAGRLTAADERYRRWADAVGVDCGPIEDEERSDLIAGVDALVAAAFGLDRGEITHIFETFHDGWQYGDRLDRTLARFEAL